MVDSISRGGGPVSPHGRPIRETDQQQGPDALKASRDPQRSNAEAAQGGDNVQLSEAARTLAEQARAVSDTVRTSGTVSADKLAVISKRIQDGFYDTEAVRHEIARRLLPDLKSGVLE